MSKQTLIKGMIKEIQQYPVKKFNVMEVRGTHTAIISKLGISKTKDKSVVRTRMSCLCYFRKLHRRSYRAT